ncbi:class I SAM-dependent methyltransferase [Kitasatospora sp. NBC_00315]|uniref:class I SAM-dependent methyltransferase n=1 Tax=Kitasatospora sp. NBC_00315 TaxID=2975963 RepID=UPI0032448E58
MAEIGYDSAGAEAYRRAREIPLDGLAHWREAVAAHAELGPDTTVLDVGAGTGMFAVAFHRWFGTRVVAVEPARGMRAAIPAGPAIEVLDGHAGELPVPDASADAAWLGSVLHHVPDLDAAVAELRRALRPGAPVLIRNAFPGRCERDLRVRYFPGTARVIDGYRTVDQVCAAFARAGFARVALQAVPHRAAPSLRQFAEGISRETDSKLRAIPDQEFEDGMARLRAEAAVAPQEPVMSWLDLLVLA